MLRLLLLEQCKKSFNTESKDVISTALVISTLRPALGVSPNEQMAWLSWMLNSGLLLSMVLCYCPASYNPISALRIFRKNFRWSVCYMRFMLCSYCKRQLGTSLDLILIIYDYQNICPAKTTISVSSLLSPGHLLCFGFYIVPSRLCFNSPSTT